MPLTPFYQIPHIIYNAYFVDNEEASRVLWEWGVTLDCLQIEGREIEKQQMIFRQHPNETIQMSLGHGAGLSAGREGQEAQKKSKKKVRQSRKEAVPLGSEAREGQEDIKEKKKKKKKKKPSKFITFDKFCWSNRLRKFVYATKDVKSWILVYSESDPQTANEFSVYLNQISKRMRISFSDPKLISLPDDNTGTYVNRIREEIRGNPQGLFITRNA